MKITTVTAQVLRLPGVTAACDGTQDTCLIRIDTDEGITGWGEVDSAPTVVAAIIEAPLSHQIANGLANALIGLDALALDACMAAMERAVSAAQSGWGPVWFFSPHSAAAIRVPSVQRTRLPPGPWPGYASSLIVSGSDQLRPSSLERMVTGPEG